MSEFGIPYMGSKDGIATEVIKVFPKAENFYDLFGGGFSITHAMLLRRSKDFKSFHFNEIKSDIVKLIKKAINGDYNYNVFKPKWISRQDFFKKIDDPFIRVCWSFGNNQKCYLFSKEIEPYKKSMHNAVVFNEFDDLAKKVFNHEGFKDGYSIFQRRLFLRSRIEYYRLNGIPEFLHPYLNEKQKKQLQNIKGSYQLQKLPHLERLQRLQRLQQLQQLQQLTFYSNSYDKIPIKDNSIIYCDPPYKGTVGYGDEINHDEFLDWCDQQSNPVFISEYNISDKRFKLIRSIKKACLLNNSSDTKKFAKERIYINKAAQDKYL